MKVIVELEFEERQDWEQLKWYIHDSIPTLVDWKMIEMKEE